MDTRIGILASREGEVWPATIAFNYACVSHGTVWQKQRFK